MTDKSPGALPQDEIDDNRVRELARLLECERKLKVGDGQLEVLSADEDMIVCRFTSPKIGSVGQTWRFERTRKVPPRRVE